MSCYWAVKVFLLALWPVLSRGASDGRIVGGDVIDIKYIPYQTSLRYRDRHICGASLLSDKWAITAAHCVQVAKVPDISLRVGSSSRSSGGQIVQVTDVVEHKDFHSHTNNNDFALLKLADWKPQDIPFGTVQLPEPGMELRDNSILRVSGWGDTQNLDDKAEDLRIVELRQINSDVCQTKYRKLARITDKMLCAGYPDGGKDACQGDSGGPLVSDITLIGVVSWGFGCASPNYPGVYARVSSAVDWIKNETGIS